MFQVGIATDPQLSDYRFKDEDRAIRCGQLLAQDKGWRVPIAVWDSANDIRHLWLCGQKFKAVS